MNWREVVGDKLTTPQEAVEAVKSGDQVMVAPFTTTPFTLCQALHQRLGQLRDVSIAHPAALFPWLKDGHAGHIRYYNLYATPADPARQ